MKKLLVTGACGQLGRAICRLYQDSDEYEIIKTDVAADPVLNVFSLDITKVEEVMEFARTHEPYCIINCAAYTAVDDCETREDLAFLINAIGPRNLAIAASEVGAKLVHVSTDYVFDGENREVPYIETDAVNPKSAYGRTKLAGEEFVRQFSRRFFILRTAWLYGEGKNFAKTMLRLAENHSEITVVDDQVGSPTSAKELAAAIAYLLPTDNYGTFHATCEGSCSWAEFAAEVLRLAGSSTKIIPVSTEEYKAKNPASADRPAYSILENRMFRLATGYSFAHWKEAIAVYMENL